MTPLDGGTTPVVVVTGASSGLGLAIARRLAAEGMQVVATVRDVRAVPIGPADAADVVPIDVALLDVTDDAARRTFVARTLARWGRIDGLVNNAGVLITGSVEDTPADATRQLFETNVFAPVELTRCVLPIMRAQGGGRVVNVTAMGAIMTTALFGAYCASKHALDAFTAALDIEGRPHGIRAASVLPGQFATRIKENSPGVFVSAPYADVARRLDEDRGERHGDVLEDPSEVTDVVLAALCDDDPPLRRLAGVGLVEHLAPVVEDLSRLHGIDLARAGVG